MKPGEYILSDQELVINRSAGDLTEVDVENSTAYIIAISSHYHFFEINRRLLFDREKAYGKRLNIPSGAWVIFQPGEKKKVSLIDYRGARKVFGLNGLVEGHLDDRIIRKKALGRITDDPDDWWQNDV